MLTQKQPLIGQQRTISGLQNKYGPQNPLQNQLIVNEVLIEVMSEITEMLEDSNISFKKFDYKMLFEVWVEMQKHV